MLRYLLALCAVLLFALQARAAPALWKLADDDTTIHIFGTLHVVKENTTWANARITSAFAASEALVVELDEKELQRAGPLMKEAGKLPLGHTMRQMVGNGIYNDVVRVSRQLDLPANIFENVRPWFAGMSLTVISLTKNGFDPSSGADRMLISEALRLRKPILGIETAAQQAAMFATLTPSQEKVILVDSLVKSQNIKAEMEALHSAWLDGDLAALDTILHNGPMEEANLGEHLIYARNRDWAGKMALLLQKPGTFFVAVGSAHLVGKRSVQVELEALGLKVAREQ